MNLNDVLKKPDKTKTRFEKLNISKMKKTF